MKIIYQLTPHNTYWREKTQLYQFLSACGYKWVPKTWITVFFVCLFIWVMSNKQTHVGARYVAFLPISQELQVPSLLYYGCFIASFGFNFGSASVSYDCSFALFWHGWLKHFGLQEAKTEKNNNGWPKYMMGQPFVFSYYSNLSF